MINNSITSIFKFSSNSSLILLISYGFFSGSIYSKGTSLTHYLRLINNIGTLLIEGANLWCLAIV